MGFIIYMFIAWIVLFFSWKRYEKAIDELRERDHYQEPYIFWLTISFSLFWIVAVPMWGIWNILEIIYKKVNKNEK